MPNVINATSTGNGGLITQGDDSGILNIQTNETTAITVDASQRVAFVAGTAALPAITTAGDTNTGIFFPAADTIAFSEGGAESMRIDASGNVGIGTTSPEAKLQVQGTVDTASSTIRITATGACSAGFACNSTGTTIGTDTGGILFKTGVTANTPTTTGTERMRINSAGNVCVATTSQIDFGLISAAANLDLLYHLVLKNTATQAGGQSYQRFLNSANSKTGSIDHTGTTTVAYTTSSDYRMKENISPMTGALTAVLQLKPCTYTWKEDGKVGQGFIAHELQEVCPDCVSGEKDAVETYTDEDGNEATRPAYQGIDTSFLVATLTAALQETKALIDTQAETINALTARIVALEGQ